MTPPRHASGFEPPPRDAGLRPRAAEGFAVRPRPPPRRVAPPRHAEGAGRAPRSRTRGARPARNARGFVLIATLWALAALAVLAAYIDGVVASDLRHALEAKRALEAEFARRSTEATLLYLLATGRMNHRALILEEEQRFSNSLPDGEFLPDHGDGEIRVTGAVYAGPGGTRFAVQDEGGLVSVNAPRFALFGALLEHSGVAASDVEGVVARVEDYIDADSVLTLNGAEHYDYRQRGEAPPLNWIMASPHELRNVLGVDELIAPAEWQWLRPLLTVRPIYSYNFNTMRPEILAVLLGLDERGMREVLEERERGSLWRLTRLAMLSGRHLDIDEMDVRLLPTSLMRVAVWHESEGSRALAGVALTPFADSAPWRKDYRYSEFIATPGGSETPRESLFTVSTPLLQ